MSISTQNYLPYPHNIVRWVRRGLSSRPQGLDGVPELTRSAYAAMAATQWTIEDAPPTLPVHEYDREAPAGDAFKATWGFNETARNEQGEVGAVCYAVRLPVGNRPTLSSVTARVVGDRYLEDGAILAVIPSSSATPPDWDDVLEASYNSGVICATGDQTAAPNNREGVITDCSVEVSETATDYLHIVLRCADYLTHRRGWIEGGAMLLPDTIELVFAADLTYERAGTTLVYPQNDIVSYESTGNVATAMGRLVLGTGDSIVYFPQAADSSNRESLNLFKKGELFIDEQRPSLKPGVSTTFNVGTDIVQSKGKYLADFAISRQDDLVPIGRVSAGASDYMFTGWLSAMAPGHGGLFGSILVPMNTDDGVWNEPQYEFELVVYRARGLPPFVPVDNAYSKNNLVCSCFDPFHFPYKAFFEDKNAIKIYFSNSTITSVVPAGGIPAADEAAALGVEFVAAWPFHGQPQDVYCQDMSSGVVVGVDDVAEFKFPRQLALSVKDVLVVGIWPTRYLGGNGPANILTPYTWKLALLQ